LLRIDFIKEYWDHVFKTFINEYQKGYTPNPDILCNKYIKFDYFLEYALSKGFDYIATGHYAQVIHTNKGSFMKEAVDQNKDQTYFLSQLSQYQLSKSLFPLAHLKKPEIRAQALQLQLHVATKKDSTGICFIGERDFKAFLSNYIPALPGPIIDYKTKQVIGNHAGVMYYTIGQSKGLGLGGHKDFEKGKWYVVAKNVPEKILYVSNDPQMEYLKADKVLITDININNEQFKGIIQADAKFRYRQTKSPVNIEWLDETSAFVSSPTLPLAISVGQACVLYQDEYCIGGGRINKVYYQGQEVTYE
ncbi:MAG: tRNA 2-thiouridine(34) synthase MnmA, partial [Bacilli bacterium]